MSSRNTLQYTVAVRTLCEFTAKLGDLDLRFTPSATALEGQAGHATVASRRGGSYRSELSLSGEFERLVVRGRADGYDPDRQWLEEVKTFRGDLSRMPKNRRALHWAQVKVYGALLCRQFDVAELTVALVYFDVVTQQETVLQERHTAAELQAFFEDQCRRFQAWSDQEMAHRGARDEGLATLRFPHAEFRAGQRPLSEAVYRAARSGRPLMAQAPTGIGKTVGTLYPLLKACPVERLDKIFFLSAKTPGRAVALESLAVIAKAAATAPVPLAHQPPQPQPQPHPLPLRVLELVAREKACEHPDKACHGESCPLANGFYDRLPAARAEAVECMGDGMGDGTGGGTGGGTMDKPHLRRIALQHGVCPYYLAQELVRWADVIVGDYNHYFDTSALLHGMTLANDWRVGVLVDEAHNLLPRARSMYSADLLADDLQAVAPLAPAAIAPSLARLRRCWADLTRQQAETGASYATYRELPVNLSSALQAVTSAVSDHLASDAAELPGPLLRFYFDVLHFTRLCESFGPHSLLDLSLPDLSLPELTLTELPTTEFASISPASSPGPGRGPGDPPPGSTLCLRNLVPAPFLKPRFAAAKTVTLFSATLSPMPFHADLLGLPDDTAWIDVESPFRAAQLQVRIAGAISTRFSQRDASLAPIAALMGRQYAEAAGNYLAFFSSFEYMHKVAALFRARHPEIDVWEQSRQMDEPARIAFLARFTVDGKGIGFAVLGGAFAEGIDLAGRRLIGAFIATLGMPPVNPVNEQMKARMDEMFGRGHDYTYLFPGLQRVVQAAGRVIRTPEDIGTLHLIDERFDRPEVRALLPAWWQLPNRGRNPHGRRDLDPALLSRA